jgi:hypothetical protein
MSRTLNSNFPERAKGIYQAQHREQARRDLLAGIAAVGIIGSAVYGGEAKESEEEEGEAKQATHPDLIINTDQMSLQLNNNKEKMVRLVTGSKMMLHEMNQDVKVASPSESGGNNRCVTLSFLQSRASLLACVVVIKDTTFDQPVLTQCNSLHHSDTWILVLRIGPHVSKQQVENILVSSVYIPASELHRTKVIANDEVIFSYGTMPMEEFMAEEEGAGGHDEEAGTGEAVLTG